MKRASYFRNGTIVGVLTMGAVHSLREDIMGQEASLALMRAAWMPAWASVPLSLLMLLAAVYLIVDCASKAAKDEAHDGR